MTNEQRLAAEDLARQEALVLRHATDTFRDLTTFASKTLLEQMAHEGKLEHLLIPEKYNHGELVKHAYYEYRRAQ